MVNRLSCLSCGASVLEQFGTVSAQCRDRFRFLLTKATLTAPCRQHQGTNTRYSCCASVQQTQLVQNAPGCSIHPAQACNQSVTARVPPVVSQCAGQV